MKVMLKASKRMRPVVKYNVVAKGSRTIPDQTLSIQEIMKRFSRGIPVDVVQRDAVYMDQSDHDFEAMSRMDFADKAAMADNMRDDADAIKDQLKADERAMKERAKKAKAETAKAAAGSKGSDIGSLDNTMSVDTTK